ncbi:MAG TPA: glycosyltransferase [Tepidisphaeraceae bacterium]|nr:glycosyltransferase [Tepidisphaeraceae bacterium]
MSVVSPQLVQRPAPGGPTAARHRKAQPATDRVRRDGKFFRSGSEKFYVKGVTYGPFALNREGDPLPDRAQVRRDLEVMVELGANTLRVYHVPPVWMLELCQELGLRVFVDVSWPKNMEFIHDHVVAEQAKSAVRAAARGCGNHPAVLAISVVNEIPADLVRLCGRAAIENFIDQLVRVGKEEAPHCLFTFANFPTTEYLRPREIDFVCFNVYLHGDEAFRNYLARLQNIAGELPLLLGEYGVDTKRENTEAGQAEVLNRQLRAVFDEGVVGTFVFSFTDDWCVNGWPIEDWAFGLVRSDRSKKPAFEVVKEVFQRAPQTSDAKLPMCSIVICSYNGASTIDACLRSMEKLRYPGEYEIIFVDDGSTDGTQQILKKYPRVRNIRQRNMGLSYARNVGMEAARGEIVVYTDGDCEADEDWLYYLALAFQRGGFVGMGGPNLIPDEESWVADCVGLSPGGPTHVMLDDREAEHVPGCNMAFLKWALQSVNGFDPQFRKAGDDVDMIWRLQDRGYSIGFAPAAQVWHYRRNTVQAYLKQQRGYGQAEAMLKFKHPDHFNILGASHWRGRIYGTDGVGIRVGRDVIYHGVFGTGLFQTIYRRQASVFLAMLMSIEWQLLAMFMVVVGLAFAPLLWVALAMFATPVVLGAVAAAQAPRPKHSHWLSRPLIALLHYRQPIVRGWARYSVRLKAKVLTAKGRGFRRKGRLPFDAGDRFALRYWSERHDRFVLLKQITTGVRAAGWRYRLDSGWNGWDMEIYGSRYVKLRITSATEKHARGNLVRLRVEPIMSNFCRALMGSSTILVLVLMLDMWPFSRTAVLIPLAWWAMFAVNRWRVSIPVLGLIDESAQEAGFYPVLSGESGRQERELTTEARPATSSVESKHRGAPEGECD